MSDPIQSFTTLQSLVFLLNSRSPSLLCSQPCWTSIYRGYGVILPSSFNTVLSSLFIYSTSSPVSDSVRCVFQLFPDRFGFLKKKANLFEKKKIYVTFYEKPFPSTFFFRRSLRYRLFLDRVSLSKKTGNLRGSCFTHDFCY